MLSHRFEYNLPLSSCDGDPAPNLAFPIGVAMLLTLGLLEKVGLFALPGVCSTGDVFAVEEPD